jgi:hypothetical protein
VTTAAASVARRTSAADPAASGPVASLAPTHVALAGLGAVGAGLVAVALGAEHLRRGGGAVPGVLLLALGAAVGMRAVVRMRRRGTTGRGEAVALAVAGAAWVGATTAGLVRTDDGVPAAATAADAALVALLLLAAGAAAAATRGRAGRDRRIDVSARRGTAQRRGGAPATLRAAAGAAGWTGTAVLVATLTATGLAGTDAGRHAVDHGGHGVPAGTVPTAPLPPGGHSGH